MAIVKTAPDTPNTKNRNKNFRFKYRIVPSLNVFAVDSFSSINFSFVG